MLIRNFYQTAQLMHIKVDENVCSAKKPFFRGVRQGDTMSHKLLTPTLESVLKELDCDMKCMNINGKFLEELKFPQFPT